MNKRVLILLVFVLGVILFLVLHPRQPLADPDPDSHAVNLHPLAKADPDPAWSGQGDFLLQLNDSFEFQLGQGSGMHGLNLVKVSADGKVVHEYRGSGRWGRKTFYVGGAELERLVNRINSLGIFRLHKSYHADVLDGTQWCLLIKAGGRRKSVYCDSYFPAAIHKLAKFVHQELIQPYTGDVQAEHVSASEHREFQKEIWASIR
jgi:hypothetical protein